MTFPDSNALPTSMKTADPAGTPSVMPVGRLSWKPDLLVFLLALVVLGMAMASLDALTSGLSGSDEGSHFLNGYLIWSYLTESFGKNPLAYATDFYVHYPKISIGHWPPLYYVFLSAFFFVLPHAVFPFLVVNLLVGALPALLVSRVVRPLCGGAWAAAAAVAYVLMPVTVNNTSRLMLDQAVAGLCLLGALVWSAYAARPSLWRGLAYAAVAAAAILVKGNGWILAVFPLFHIALTGRWRLLANWRTYAAAAAAIVVVGAWTVVTYKISSDGFNYAWGFKFFSLALPTFLLAIYKNLGLVGTAAAVAGIAACLTAPPGHPLREPGKTGLALVLATLIFQSIVPVDLDERYVSPALPSLAAFMAIGAWAALRRWPALAQRSRPVLLLLLVVFSLPGLLHLQHRPKRYDLRMDLVATQIEKLSAAAVVVVDGHAGAEGALASEVALRDTQRQDYVVRSSQLLAKSDFMGTRYALKVGTPEEVLGLLNDLGCGVVVVTEGENIVPRFPHSDQLMTALQLSASPFRLAETYEHRGEKGQTKLFVRDGAPVPRLDAVKRVNFPEKAPK